MAKIADVAKLKTSEAMTEIADVAGKAKLKTSKTMELVADEAKETMGEIADAAEKAKLKASKTMELVADEAKETMGEIADVAGKAKLKASKTMEQIADVGHHVGDHVASMANMGKKKKPKGHDVGDHVASIANLAKVKSKVHKMRQQQTINSILAHETQNAHKDEKNDGGDVEGPNLLKGYTRSKLFTNVVSGFIVCNVAAIAIETDYGDETGGIAIFEHVTCVVFLGEMIMKILDEGRSYFKRKWNIFDFVLSWYSILDIWGALIFPILKSNSGALSSLRILRIVRVVKVLRQNQHLRLCLAGISAGSSTIVVVACLVFFFYLSSRQSS